jgi:hypothetical protein
MDLVGEKGYKTWSDVEFRLQIGVNWIVKVDAAFGDGIDGRRKMRECGRRCKLYSRA